MKHIRKFESYRIKKHREEIIKESVLQVNDIYKVKTMIDIPQSLINAYIKKVKDTTGKNLRQFFGDVDLAEEIVKYITLNNLDVDKIPGGALMGGGQNQAQTQTQVQPAQTEVQMQIQPQAQPQAQIQGQPQMQTEAQPAAQIQTEVQPQSQENSEFEEPQAQVQTQGQGQSQSEEEDEESEESTDENEEELPL